MASLATATDRGAPPCPGQQAFGVALSEVRGHTHALVAHLSDEQLSAVHSPIMSPLVWDLGHIAAYEDLWLAHRLAGMELLRGDLAAAYDAFETPRAVRGEVEKLGPAQARAYMAQVRERVLAAFADGRIDSREDICEMVLRHESQHCETMRQTMDLAGLLPPGEPPPAPHLPVRAREDERVDEWVELPAGPFAMGAGAEGFAYDNERPRHVVDVPEFQIARWPVSAAQWMQFARAGGYERRACWSPEGWAWKEALSSSQRLAPHPAIAEGDPDAPVCHVSWHEADAFARAQGARLPSEAEWEKAATTGALADVGYVWEWTASSFGGYPGFVAHPYREYSEVFFGDDYRVLRGGSWASSPRVKTVTFRNWDLPRRSQIFAGVRLARDV